VIMSGCQVSGGISGIQFERGTRGAITDCRLSDFYNVGVNIVSGSVANLTGNSISGGQVSIRCEGVISGAHNVLRGATYAAMRAYTSVITMHDNHILFGGRRLVQLDAFVDPPATKLDFRSNYWGITDRDSIAALIWDGNDDPRINGFVEFEPFSATPLPTEKKSLGNLKSLYR
jgi:hypothetical protein